VQRRIERGWTLGEAILEGSDGYAGSRPVVVGIRCDPKWRAPAGIALAGLCHFGHQVCYVPIEQRLGRF
jgi:DUF917 family protein